ncbi:hypothetical protein L596_007123 [Steinernema carpocapsae]|uniref:Uncharacterized protein n=1 Tax=Steinernema carpocapsae TaxID=34508 RepID=A0A4U5P8A0_STECR|nr:hypothetical protein L596_007123 [Steinernema carpocapsae]
MRRTADETHFAGPDRSHFSLRREPFEPGERLLSGRFSRFRHALLGTLDLAFAARFEFHTWECSLVSCGPTVVN